MQSRIDDGSVNQTSVIDGATEHMKKRTSQSVCRLGVLFVLSCQLFAQPQTPITRSGNRAVPLTRNERDVYAAFLNQYVSTFKKYAAANPDFINLADTTEPLDLTNDLNEEKNKECFGGISFTSVRGAGKDIHKLETSLTSERDLRLVNKAEQAAIRQAITHGLSATTVGKITLQANVLQLSEIAFDNAQRFAAIRYTFTCGTLCGKGGVVIFEKLADGWRDANRPCAEWIS